MGLTFAYMPPRTYTRLAEYVQQIRRAMIGGQMSCGSVDGLGNPASEGIAGIPATRWVWLACSGV